MARGGKRPGAGRPKGIPVSKETQARRAATIDTQLIIQRLNQFIQGEIKMEPAAVSAALGLLKKKLPDLAAVAHSGEISLKPASTLSDDELAAIALKGGGRTTETSDDTPIVH